MNLLDRFLKRAVARLRSVLSDDRRAPPAPAAAIAPATPPPGPTRAHYRAFSLLQGRLSTMPHIAVMEGFRDTAKRLKLTKDAHVHAEGFVLLDRFAAIVDEYVPLWKSAAARNAKEAREIETDLVLRMVILERELGRMIDEEQARTNDRDGFDRMGRFIDKRYAACEQYGLTVD